MNSTRCWPRTSAPIKRLVALGGPGRLVKIYAVRDGALLHKMKKHTDWVTAVASRRTESTS